TLDVDDDEGQLGGHRQADGFGFECHAGSAGGGDPDVASVGGADGGADRRDFVFSLDSGNAEVFVAAQLVQDVAGGGDGIGAQHQRQASLLARCDQPPRCSHVPADVAVEAGLDRGAGYLVAVVGDLRSFAIGVPSLEREHVG